MNNVKSKVPRQISMLKVIDTAYKIQDSGISLRKDHSVIIGN